MMIGSEKVATERGGNEIVAKDECSSSVTKGYYRRFYYGIAACPLK